MAELTPEERAIVDAWVKEGRNPWYHQEQMRHLRDTWPVLYKAIVLLVMKSKKTR